MDKIAQLIKSFVSPIFIGAFILSVLSTMPARAYQGEDTATATNIDWGNNKVRADTLAKGRTLFEKNCGGSCHSLDFALRNDFDRNTWEWVIDDMVNKYGVYWLTDEETKLIIDYLSHLSAQEIER